MAVQRRGHDAPWLRVAGFHREVAARAEQEFFSLNGRDDQSERWTSLDAFEPADLAGPWQMDSGVLRSAPFRLALEQGEHESLILGGPCFTSWVRGTSGWIAHWRPLLYREVAVRRDGESLELIPQQGNWSLSGTDRADG